MLAYRTGFLTGALLVAAIVGSASTAGATPPAPPAPHPVPNVAPRVDTVRTPPTTLALAKAGQNHKDAPAPVAKAKASAATVPAAPAGAPGTLFVRKSDGDDKWLPKAVYLGKFGGKNYGLEGDWLVVLSKDTVEQNHLHANADLPLIPQTALGDGVSSSLAYLQRISGVKAPVGTAGSAAITATFTPSPLFAAFFPHTFQSSTTVPARGTALAQKGLVHDALEKSGLKVTSTTSLEAVFGALEQGKKVFVGVKAADGRTTVQDEHDGSIRSVQTLEPYHGGAEGQAMVAVGTVKNAFGERIMLLAEPSSGALITMKEKNLPGALQYGLIVD